MHRGKPTVVGPGVVREMPELGTLIGEIASAWSYVELHLALLMASMLGVENKAAIAVFTTMRNHRAQRDALNAAASVALSEEKLEVFRALFNLHRQYDGQRNDVVHGVWGRSDAIPDAAIWESTNTHACMIAESYRLEGTPRTQEEHVAHQCRGYYVYRFDDLRALRADIETLETMIRNLHVWIRYDGRSAGETARHRLGEEPLLQSELNRMRNLPGKTPSVQP
jgi:hypothetical protein